MDDVYRVYGLRRVAKGFDIGNGDEICVGAFMIDPQTDETKVAAIGPFNFLVVRRIQFVEALHALGTERQ